MTLYEFVKKSSYLNDTFEDMKYRIGEKDKIVELEKWRKNLDVIYKRYYIIMGYLKAAYDYGQISLEEDLALEDELDLVMLGKEG